MSGQYSLDRVSVAITAGDDGTFTASGYEVGAADEYISYSFDGDLVSVITGDYGYPEHSTIQSRTGTVKLRLLQTSPLNAALMNFANDQNSNFNKLRNVTIVIFDRGVSGGRELVTMTGCSLLRYPARSFVQSATPIEWEFTASRIIQKRGE